MVDSDWISYSPDFTSKGNGLFAARMGMKSSAHFLFFIYLFFFLHTAHGVLKSDTFKSWFAVPLIYSTVRVAAAQRSIVLSME